MARQRGQHEGRENDPYDYHTPDWRQATHGYKNWMGPLDAFQNGYQQGYADGFRSGFNSERPDWRGDGDATIVTAAMATLAMMATTAGCAVTTRDTRMASRWRGTINIGTSHSILNPRGRFDDRDHGYRREYGDKSVYRSQYTDGYRAGYQATFNGRY